MKTITTLFLLILTLPVNPAIRPYEVKPERQACAHRNYFAACVPKIKKAEVNDKVNWI